MWAKALSAGAVDFCNSGDIKAIAAAACGVSDFSHAQAA
jgi:hypothetical protein